MFPDSQTLVIVAIVECILTIVVCILIFPRQIVLKSRNKNMVSQDQFKKMMSNPFQRTLFSYYLFHQNKHNL